MTLSEYVSLAAGESMISEDGDADADENDAVGGVVGDDGDRHKLDRFNIDVFAGVSFFVTHM
jgi:hypothetical protein